MVDRFMKKQREKNLLQVNNREGKRGLACVRGDKLEKGSLVAPGFSALMGFAGLYGCTIRYLSSSASVRCFALLARYSFCYLPLSACMLVFVRDPFAALLLVCNLPCF